MQTAHYCDTIKPFILVTFPEPNIVILISRYTQLKMNSAPNYIEAGMTGSFTYGKLDQIPIFTKNQPFSDF